MTLGYEKSLLGVTAKTELVRYDTFSVEENGKGGGKSGALVGTESENCDLTDGVIRAGFGITPYLFDDGTELSGASSLPEADAYFTLADKQEDGTYAEKLGFITLTGTVFLYDETTGTMKSKYAFGTRMKAVAAIDGEERTGVVFAGEAGVYFYTETDGMVECGPTKAVAAACVCKDRVFCAEEPFAIRYSAPLQPTDFSESIEDGGRIVLPSVSGKIVALVTFQGAVYVFYEYGISKLETAGGAREFKLEKLGYGGGKIFGDSVGVCSVGGEKAFFLASDGAYVFDGENAERICENLKIQPVCEGQVCGHAEFDGKYFLRFVDTDGEKRGLVVDAATKTGYRAFAPKGLSACRGKGICFADSKLRRLEKDGSFPSGTTYAFSAAKTDFGIAGKKTLESVRFFGEGQIVVMVGTGRREKTVKVKFENGEAKMRVWLRGEYFSLQIVLKKGASVNGAVAKIVRLGSREKSALGRRKEG